MSDKIESEILDVLGEEVDAAVDTPLVVIEGPKGDPGAPGKDGHSPVVTATKSGKTTTISVDGAAIATVEDGADGAPGKDGADGSNGKDGKDGAPGAKGTDGITPTIGANGHWYLGTTDTGKPSRGEKGEKGDPGKDGANGETGPAGPRGEKGADGSNGKDGAPGEKGDKGDPGIYYGTTQPTGDTHPVWIDPDGGPDDGGLLPAVTAEDNGKILRVVSSAWTAADMPTGGTGMDITGAKVGQIAKITAVDDTGKPIAWSPVDMPSGGGEKWEMIAEIELRTDTAMYELADFGVWRKAKVIMTRPKYISGLSKNVWCKVVGNDGGDAYSCGYLTSSYGYVFWEFSAEVTELFVSTRHIASNNRNATENVESTGTFIPPTSPAETYKFKLQFVDTSAIQAGDKVTVIGVRR